MSLSSYLKRYRPTVELFGALPDLKREFHSIARNRKRGTPLRVPARALEPVIVGTAFDYWLRAWLARTWPSVPRQDGAWIAETTFNGFPQFWEDTPENESLGRRLKQVRELYASYIGGDKSVYREFILGCVFLARLDLVYRANVEVPDFLKVNRQDAEDLLALADLTRQRRYLFEPRERLIQNPNFGYMSSVVGGADADILLDNHLIDIKVSASARSPRATYQRQLVGYWILAAMEGSPWPIERLGVYLARDGILFSMPVGSLLHRVDVQFLARSFMNLVARERAGGRAREAKELIKTLAPKFALLDEAVTSLSSRSGHEVC